ILREIARLERIIQDLLRVTHPQELMLTDTSISDVIENSLKSLGPTMSRKPVSLELQLSGEIPLVAMDADQMQQVFINLVKNAIDAVESDGRICIEAHSEEGTLDQGAVLKVSVTDSGCGIESENLERIFEPFFTTKLDGTGLGLYVSYNIVRRHDGEISVSSEVGRGTTFCVELPVTRG
ncbi:MAG: ATP-binding protein, partial [Candidatus Eisenbacteria bacterium]